LAEELRSITINEALVWAKTLKERHSELVGLRNTNSYETRSYLGANAEKEIVKSPTYDVKVLDKMITRLSREMRLLEQAIKHTNATTPVLSYTQDDSVLGEL
jgi:hypothetical protein